MEVVLEVGFFSQGREPTLLLIKLLVKDKSEPIGQVVSLKYDLLHWEVRRDEGLTVHFLFESGAEIQLLFGSRNHALYRFAQLPGQFVGIPHRSIVSIP